MPDQNTSFPTEEPPAAPFGQVGPVSPPQPLVQPMVESAQSGVTPPVVPALPTETVQGAPVSSSPKRRFPIKIILVILVLLILGVAGFFGFQFLKNRVPVAPLTQNTISWWGLWEDSSIVEPLIAEYEAQNPNAQIEYVQQSPKDYRERLESSLAKGDGPDIFFFHNSWAPMFKDRLDKIPAGTMSAGEFAETFYPVSASDVTSGTGLVGIPLGYDAITLYINQDIFDAAGKTSPTTWDELREIAQDLTTRDDEGLITQAGVALGLTKNVDHWPEILALMMLQNGAKLAEPEGDEAEKALEFYTLFAGGDGVWDENMPTSTVAFAAGKVAMIFGPSWRAFEIKEQNPNLRFKAVNPPHLPKEDPNEPDIGYATYWIQGVWEGSSQKDEAWKFLKYMSEAQTLEKLYGNASKLRLFGEPYPRVDMADLLISHPLLGGIVSQGPTAVSWYLADRTFDGPTGINSQINKYYEDAVNAVNDGADAKVALATTAKGVAQILAQFGITSP